MRVGPYGGTIRGAFCSGIATAFIALACLPADAAEITEPAHGIVVAYNDRLWSAALNGKYIDFDCRSAECGGEAASCRVSVFPIKPGYTAKDFSDTFEREFIPNFVPGMETQGLSVDIVDVPTSFMVGDDIAALSFVRYNEGGVPTRQSFYQFAAPFGVVLAACRIDEDKYDAVHNASLKLVEGIAIPKS